uniref:Lipoma HMGIC fusion partner-like 2 protein n=2 Tax=Hirondellea gigas TaxID=1518452 RepID=A0A2P2I645_9CRUS
MCLVLLNTCSVLWSVASVMSTTLLLGAHLSSHWLLGHPVILHHNTPLPPPAAHDSNSTTVITGWVGEVEVRPSLGLWLRCTVMAAKKGGAARQYCGVYATTGADLPAAQVVAMASLVTGTGIAVLATLSMLLSACCRVVRKKSIFNIAGTMHALAGVFCILGLSVYPLSWGCVRVQLQCGPMAGEYSAGNCSIGWALYSGLAGTALLLVCAVWAVFVDKTISSNRAEEEIRRGNHFVCLM